MLRWSKRSKENMEGIHPDLRMVLDHVLDYGFDITVVEGVRDTQRQQHLYAQGRTRPGSIVTYTDGIKKISKHQIQTDGYGHAVDVYPFPIKMDQSFYNQVRFYYLAGRIDTIAQYLYASGEIEHLVRWGGNWDKDSEFGDQRFMDLPHFELYKP